MNERFQPQETIAKPELKLDSKKLSEALKLYRAVLMQYETADGGELTKGELAAQADLTDTFAVLSELRSITQNGDPFPPNWEEFNGQIEFGTKDMATLKPVNGAWKIDDILLKTPLAFVQHFDLIAAKTPEERSAYARQLRQSRESDSGVQTVYKPEPTEQKRVVTTDGQDSLRDKLQNANLGNTKKGWWR